MKELQIIDAADQLFSTTLNGVVVSVRMWYNRRSDRWSMTIMRDGTEIIAGRKVVTGIDLFKDFDLGIGIVTAAAMEDGAVAGRHAFVNGTVKIFTISEADVDLVLEA